MRARDNPFRTERILQVRYRLEGLTWTELLATVAAQLLAVESATLRDQAEALFARHRGNLRDALREWYDLLAQNVPPLPARRRQ